MLQAGCRAGRQRRSGDRPGQLLAIGLPLLLLGCTPPEQAPSTIDRFARAGAPQTPQRLRALSNAELENVLGELLGADRPGLTAGFLPDPRVSGFDNDALALGVSESEADEIATVAARVGALVSDPAAIDRHAPCPTGDDPATCAAAFVERAARRAWGRPLTSGERQRLAGVYLVGSEEGGGYRGGIALSAEALLTSPHFVYRTEIGVPAPGGASRVSLTDTEIASALSFLISGGRPDDELLAAAAAGKLASPDERERQLRRLLPTAPARRQLARFVRAWLGMEEVAMLNKDLAAYPQFTPELRRALDRELSTFLDQVFAGGGRLQELLLADHTFPAPVLTFIYGEDLLQPPGEFTAVPLHPRRRGILSSPGFLASHAQLIETSPVERGLVVRSRMLCDDPPPPPLDVFGQQALGTPGHTTRQKFEAHSRDPSCLVCHQLIDPVGFGLEAFDAIGRYRTMEGTLPVDARGELVGTDVDGPFTGPAELSRRLMGSRQFQRCFARKLFQFAEGRPALPADDREIDHLSEALGRGGRIDEALVALVRRPVFVQRRRAEGIAGHEPPAAEGAAP